MLVGMVWGWVALAGVASAAGAGEGRGGGTAAEAPGAEEESLRRRVEVLTEEVRRLKERMALPATEKERQGRGVAGGAAGRPGLSIGGYGEFHYTDPLGSGSAGRRVDLLRLVTYVGYRFSDRILLDAELEYEHATTSGEAGERSGSVSVEFAYLEFLLGSSWRVRTGNLLVPMGFVNEMHEPPFYRGNLRPQIERYLIPTTWREMGIGLVGRVVPGWTWRAYLLDGFDAKGFGPRGVRGGRQKGNRALAEDWSGVLALDVEAAGPVRIGGSVYAGQSDQNQAFDGKGISALVTISEVHGEVRHHGFRGRALLVATTLGDAGAVSRDLSSPGEEIVVPGRQEGWYLEGAYDVAPWLGMRPDVRLLAWVRWEEYDLQEEVPAGLRRDAALDVSSLTLGLELKPHPSVVLKGEVEVRGGKPGGGAAGPLRLGAGFAF